MNDNDAGSRPECGRYADGLAELALGILMGRDRALVLAHVEGCSDCHAEVEQLSLAADSLLEMAPDVEPPLGFEVRLMERFRAGPAAQRRVRWQWRLRQPSLVLAGLLMFGAVGVGAGWLAWGGQHQTVVSSAFGTAPGGQIETESLVTGGRTLGKVVVYSGRTSWLFMSLDDGSWSGKASCEVRLVNGKTVPLGTFWLEHGYGAWGVTLPPGTGRIQAASVMTDQGVLASAHFPSGTMTSAVGAAGDQGVISGPSWKTQ
jgi:hypothetical protein